GSWMQMIGQGWLVLQLTNSPFWLGMVAFARAVPVLAFSLFAGAVADRVDRRRLLLATQSTAGVLALLLAVLTSTGLVRVGAGGAAAGAGRCGRASSRASATSPGSASSWRSS